MKVNKGDSIKDGENIFSVFCVLGSVIYVQKCTEVNNTPVYQLSEVLKHYRKIEIIGDKRNG